MEPRTIWKLRETHDFCSIWPYHVFFDLRYSIGCRKHVHCYIQLRTWQEARQFAILTSKMPEHRDCLVTIHDGQSGFQIGFVNGIMGIVANFDWRWK